MVMTDPVADLLTRIRNGLMAKKTKVRVPSSKEKVAVLRVLKSEGFIEDFDVEPAEPRNFLLVLLKYGPDGQSVIRSIQRVSKPGRRIYRGASALKPVLKGQGLAVVSTSQGMLSDRECRAKKVGGEVLCNVW